MTTYRHYTLTITSDFVAPDGANEGELKSILADQMRDDYVGYIDLARFEPTDKTFEEED